MKRILLILMVTVALLTSCMTGGKETTVETLVQQEPSSPLVYVVKNNGIHIYYDRDTKVMYATFYQGGIIMLVNADGTPKLYKK